MPNFRRLIVAATLLLHGCAALTARHEFAAADFGLAYLQPQSRAELPTLPTRALQAELAGIDKAFGKVEAAAKGLPGPQASQVRSRAAAVRGLLDAGFRARLTARVAQGGPGLADRFLAHDRLGALGYAPIPRAPGDDADSKAANLAINEADLALRAAEKAAALAELARSMVAQAGSDLIDAEDTKAPAAVAVTAYAAIAAARLSIEALAEAATASGKLTAADRRLAAAASNQVVAMRTGAAAGRIAGGHIRLEAVERAVPAYLENAAKLLAAAKALK